MAKKSETLQTILKEKDILWTVARAAIEDEAIDLRDRSMIVGVPLRNGIAVNYSDGSPGPIRFSTFEAVRIALEALAAHYEKAGD